MPLTGGHHRRPVVNLIGFSAFGVLGVLALVASVTFASSAGYSRAQLCPPLTVDTSHCFRVGPAAVVNTYKTSRKNSYDYWVTIAPIGGRTGVVSTSGSYDVWLSLQPQDQLQVKWWGSPTKVVLLTTADGRTLSTSDNPESIGSALTWFGVIFTFMGAIGLLVAWRQHQRTGSWLAAEAPVAQGGSREPAVVAVMLLLTFLAGLVLVAFAVPPLPAIASAAPVGILGALVLHRWLGGHRRPA